MPKMISPRQEHMLPPAMCIQPTGTMRWGINICGRRILFQTPLALSRLLIYLGAAYNNFNKPDSALLCLQQAEADLQNRLGPNPECCFVGTVFHKL